MQVATHELTQISLRSGASLEALTVIRTLTDRYAKNNIWTAEHRERLSLKNAVENHFTAKQQRAQRTYIKNKIRLFGEVLDHTKLSSKPCLSFVSLRLCVGNLNSYCRVQDEVGKRERKPGQRWCLCR